MNYRKLITFSIPILWISCANNTDNKNKPKKIPDSSQPEIIEQNILDSNVYADINLFKLEGTNKINRPSNYPFIKIEEKGDSEKRILYKKSKKDSVERLYKFESKYWTTSYDYKTDTGYGKVYEYINPNKIIELDYRGTYQKKDYHLHDASIINKDSMITFGFGGEKGLKIDPDPNNFEVVKKAATTFYIDKMNLEKDKIIQIWTRIDYAHGYSFYSDTSCYEVNNHSWFWWRYFTGQKIKCK